MSGHLASLSLERNEQATNQEGYFETGKVLLDTYGEDSSWISDS